MEWLGKQTDGFTVICYPTRLKHLVFQADFDIYIISVDNFIIIERPVSAKS